MPHTAVKNANKRRKADIAHCVQCRLFRLQKATDFSEADSS